MIAKSLPLLLVIWLWTAGSELGRAATFGSSAPRYYDVESIDDGAESEAEIVEAASPLPGATNLQEKRIPLIRLTVPAGYLGLYRPSHREQQQQQQQHHAERVQVPRDQLLEPALYESLPGVRNLAEKALPEAFARASARDVEDSDVTTRTTTTTPDPNFEVEKVEPAAG